MELLDCIIVLDRICVRFFLLVASRLVRNTQTTRQGTQQDRTI